MYERKKPFVVERLAPKIWLANFENQYDLAMTFLRYAEFYECPNLEFRGKSFSILDYMDWYSKTYGNGSFTYPKDWVGFNVPNDVIAECINVNKTFEDSRNWNVYDEWMQEIYDQVRQEEGSYVLGACGKDNDTFLHELSHAMYCTDPVYQAEQNQNIALMDPKDREAIKRYLIKIGYSDDNYIIMDETQAYLSTGLTHELKKKKRLNAYIINFQTVFNKRNPLK